MRVHRHILDDSLVLFDFSASLTPKRRMGRSSLILFGPESDLSPSRALQVYRGRATIALVTLPAWSSDVNWPVTVIIRALSPLPCHGTPEVSRPLPPMYIPGVATCTGNRPESLIPPAKLESLPGRLCRKHPPACQCTDPDAFESGLAQQPSGNDLTARRYLCEPSALNRVCSPTYRHVQLLESTPTAAKMRRGTFLTCWLWCLRIVPAFSPRVSCCAETG